MPSLSPDDTNALKRWIENAVSKLPIEVNPSILAAYIKNLVNNDTPAQQMASQLDGFIPNDHIDGFIKDLFSALQTKSFLQGSASEAPKPAPPKPAPPKETKARPETPARKEQEKSKPVPKETKSSSTDKKVEKRKEEKREERHPKDERKKDDRREDKYSRDERKKDDRRSRDSKPDDHRGERREDRRDDRRDDRKKDDRKDKYNKDDRSKKDDKFKKEDRYKKDTNERQEKKKHYDSDEYSESDQEESGEQQLTYIPDEEPEMKPEEKHDRFIVFVAGLEGDYNSIGRIYKAFKPFGRIAGIEEDKENGVCFIEYTKLSNAYRAVQKGAKKLQNSFLRVEWATEPDPAAIKAIEDEIERKRLEYQKMNEQQQQPQSNENSIESEKEKIKEDIMKAIRMKLELYERLDDGQTAEKEKLKHEMDELSSMLDEVSK